MTTDIILIQYQFLTQPITETLKYSRYNFTFRIELSPFETKTPRFNKS